MAHQTSHSGAGPIGESLAEPPGQQPVAAQIVQQLSIYSAGGALHFGSSVGRLREPAAPLPERSSECQVRSLSGYPLQYLRRDSRNGSLQAGGPAAGRRVRAAVAASLFPCEEVAPGVCVWPLAQRAVGRGKSARGARGGDRAHHLLQRPEARAGACVAGRQNPIPATDVGSSRAWIGIGS